MYTSNDVTHNYSNSCWFVLYSISCDLDVCIFKILFYFYFFGGCTNTKDFLNNFVQMFLHM